MGSAPSALSEHCLLLWLETIPTPQQFTPTVLLKRKELQRGVQIAHLPFLKINPLKITYKPPMASTSHGQAHRWKHSPGLAPRASAEVAKVPAKTVLSPSSKQGTQG